MLIKRSRTINHIKHILKSLVEEPEQKAARASGLYKISSVRVSASELIHYEPSHTSKSYACWSVARAT